MYEEKEIEFDWKGFLLKLALVIVVAILIIKLLPLNNNNAKELSTEFKNNMATLRVKSNDYFSNDKLPNKVDESVRVTLDDLVKVGVVRALTDTNGNSCSPDNSYVKATKRTNNYELEIYLLCGKEEDLTYVYLNQSSDNVPKVEETPKENEVDNTVDNNTNNSTNTNKGGNYAGGGNSSSNNSNNNVNYVTSKITKTTVPANSVSIIFNSNGGTKISTQYIKKGSAGSRPANPTRAGYTFLGWMHNGKEYNFNSATNNNVTLIARWSANSNIKPGTTTKKTTTTTRRIPTTTSTKARYVVRFNSNGGTSKSSQTVYYNEYASKPSNPTKSNAVFLGWYYNNEPFNFKTRIRGDITLVAKYRETRTMSTNVYSAGWGKKVNSFEVTHTLKKPEEFNDNKYKNVRIKSLKFVRSLSSSTDIYNYKYLHNSTFDQPSSNYDYLSLVSNNLANIRSASINKVSSAIYDRQVKWVGTVSNQCSTSFNYGQTTNACVYGILYSVTWEYEIEN